DLWDPWSHRMLNTIRFGEGKAFRFAFFPDGNRLAAASDDGAIWVCSLNPPTTSKVLSGLRARVDAVRISRDARLLATGDINGTIRLFDLQSSTLLHEL